MGTTPACFLCATDSRDVLHKNQTSAQSRNDCTLGQYTVQCVRIESFCLISIAMQPDAIEHQSQRLDGFPSR
jgi:hypothetical protein